MHVTPIGVRNSDLDTVHSFSRVDGLASMQSVLDCAGTFQNIRCRLLQSMICRDCDMNLRSGARHTKYQLPTLTLERLFSALGAILDVRQRDGMFPTNGEKIFRRWRHGSVRSVRLQQGHQSNRRLGRLQRFRCVQAFGVYGHAVTIRCLRTSSEALTSFDFHATKKGIDYMHGPSHQDGTTEPEGKRNGPHICDQPFDLHLSRHARCR